MTILLVLSVLFTLAGNVFAAPPVAAPATAPQTATSARSSAPAPVASGPETVDSAVQRLTTDAQGEVSISYRAATGTVSFARAGKGGNLYPAGAGESAEAQALGFLADYGAVFGIRDAGAQLVSAGSLVDAAGNTRLAYTQVHQGVPVFGSYLRVVVAANGALTSANAATVPGIKVSAIPGISAEKAGAAALKAAGDAARGALVSTDVRVLATRLLVFREGLVENTPNGLDRLVYEVEVGNGSSVREFIYVDAHSGEVVDRIDAIQNGQEAPQALTRQISESSLANVVWTNPSDPDPIPGGWAGGTVQQVTDWNNEAAGSKETYNLFGSMAGWDSYDNLGSTMRVVNNDPGIFCPNANWNGTSTNYCTNVTGDDTVAHEWGHAYTDFTSGLIYQWQSGAMNESYSDIWGEVVDLLNGRGTDTPGGPRASDGSACSIYGSGSPSTDNTYRWLSGEDDPAFGGAIRDMWRPECYGDPGKVSSANYWCSTGDGGGVHTNSGVPNHAFALMTDGGTFNGHTVTALGLTKTSHIFWQAQSVYLGPASNFADLADALEQSCTDLTGVNLFSLSTSGSAQVPSGQVIAAADCQEVADAVTATELRTPPTQCNFQPLLDPNAPALCAGQGTGVVEPIASEDWEGGVLPAGWSVGTYGVANPVTFDTPDWAVVGSLPAGANGNYAAFVGDLIIGDCVADDESGALYLQSPAIVIPAGADVPRVAFDHWVATEMGYDGGNLKVSVNGGPFTLVPDAAFEFNDYNMNLVGAGNTNPMAGQSAFSGTDGGQVGGSWGQSQVNLTGIAGPGDSVVFRIDFGVDGCNGVVGWYVDDFEVYSCQDEGAGGQCGNGLLDPGEQCDDANTNNGDGCSDTCQVEQGWTCTAPVPGGNVVDDPSFEAGTPNPSWTEASTNFGTPVCDVPGCGTGTGTGPHTGDWWSWFGGIGAYEAGSVSQAVTMPSGGSASLNFWVEQAACSGDPADYMEVNMDGAQLWSTNGAAPECNTVGYRQETVDVSVYADGGVHTLEFNSEIFGGGGLISNFFVDDVEIPGGAGTPSICTPTGGGATTYCSNLTTPLPIPDNNAAGVSNDIVISDDVAITDLNLTVDTIHTWVGDLKYILTRVDSGTTTTPIDRPGVPASTFGCSGNNIDATIDDEGTDGNVESTCLAATPTIAGDLVGGDPANTSLLSAYDGLSSMATWRLTVSDNAGGDTGALVQWCLEVSGVGNDPNIDVSPLSMASTQPTNTSTQQMLTVANTGGGTLNWVIDEENLSAPDLILPTHTPAYAVSADAAAKAAARQPATIGDNALSAAGTGAGQTVTPSRPATPDGLVTITHSVSQSIVALNSVSCNNGSGHTNNAYLRVFDLAAFGLPNGMDVTQVEFGIEDALSGSGSQPLTVNLYVKTNPVGPLTYANLTSIGTANVNISDQSSTLYTVPVAGSAPAGSVLVVEVFTPNGQAGGNMFFIGSNAAGQTGPSYLAAADCGVPEPTDTAALGFPNMHIVMNVTGDADVTPATCSALADIPWLSLSPTNGANAGGTNTQVTVTFNSNSLANGVYTGNLCVTSNDPDAGPGNGTDLVIVPVTLTVQPPTAVTLTDLAAGVDPMPAPAGVPLGAVAAAGLSMALAAGYATRRRRS
ncbi:MAG TPA: M4 family metallopeptidase [Anaerolineae bacterium]|nr:M4 family metallopeptidase [Anaerolineae bacterium]